MKASELRIGNLVTDEWYPDFNKTITVESICDTGINMTIEDDGNWSELAQHYLVPEYKFEKLRGIPLTEEKLLSLGLIKDATLFRPVESIHEKCQGDIGFKCPSFFFNSRLNRWMDCQTRVCVDYVHQVQNLVYQLTGEELTPQAITSSK